MFKIDRIRHMKELKRVTEPTLLVLKALVSVSGSSTWGLEIVRATNLKSGTVYPILERLEGLGWVTSEWESNSQRTGPRRKLYRLTSEALTAADTLLVERIPSGSTTYQSLRPTKLA